MVSSWSADMRTNTKAVVKRKSKMAGGVSRKSQGRGGVNYLLLIAVGTGLNLVIGVTALVLILSERSVFPLIDRGILAEVQSDPSTGLIVPQKPLGVQLDPLEGADVLGGGDRAWLDKSAAGEDAQSEPR